MILDVFGVIGNAFGQFISLYTQLDATLQISAFAFIALVLWSVVRFLILPIMGGNYSINDAETDILTETVTEANTVRDRPVKLSGGRKQTRTVTTTTSRTSRKRVKR